eukprot:gene30612-36988_t
MSTYAANGGLFVPFSIPNLSEETFLRWKDFTFPQVCANVLALFSDIDLCDLLKIADEAFSLFNDGADSLPLTKVGSSYFLDTSLGPTFAFKDIGQQMLGRILNHILGRKSKKATILVETSGDTGPAAIAGVKGCLNVEIFCLYPHGRVSSVQELQMITNADPNVHIYRTDGNTDEQASLLKEIFADHAFVADHNICSVNSINWVRIAAQSSYYVWAYLQMKYHKELACDAVDFVIPTGAFGNAMGGYLAKLMGVPIGKIYCATNTESPAMDIQFAYNLERMLYFICDQDCVRVFEIMGGLEQQFLCKEGATGTQLPSDVLNKIQAVFDSRAVTDAETLATIRSIDEQYGIELCPHSAVGVTCALQVAAESGRRNPLISVLTAHPAKFESSIEKALQRKPKFPKQVEDLRTLPHRFKSLEKTHAAWRQEWIETLKRDVHLAVNK